MGISCGGHLIKYALFAFNFVIFILGAGIITLGVLVMTKYTNDIKDVMKETPHQAAIILLVAGGCVAIFAFFGCCGAIRESSTMLMIYGFLVFACLVAQGVGAYFVFKYNTDFTVHAEKAIRAAMESYQPQLGEDDPRNRPIEQFQRELQCCGANSMHNWDDIMERKQMKGVYPASCCAKSADATSQGKCPAINVMKKNCVEAIREMIKSWLGGLGYLAVVVALVECLVLVSACCLARETRKYSQYGSPGTARA